MILLCSIFAMIGFSVGHAITQYVASAKGPSNGSMLLGKAASQKSSSSKESTPEETAKDRYENIELFQKVLQFVETNYVDPVKNKELIYGAIKGMLETLDPHSNFMPPDVFKDMKIDTSGKFGGLGIEIGQREGVLTIISPMEDTPAWKAGLKSGDRIVKINKESTRGLTLMEAVSKMRGKKGTSVTLSIYRDGFDRIKDVSLVRDIIKIQSVKYETLGNGYGYVRLTNFNETASQDIKKAIDKMEKEGPLKGLVFDLRNNPGGLLDQAVDVSSLFIDEGVVVSTAGRDKNAKEYKYAKKGMARKDLPVAILVNSTSASASEIVAGALQDNHRAIILGQPTFGKGSVQTLVELGQDMGLKLTIARYYTPSGRSIQDKGVQPDVILDDYDPKLLEKAKRKGDSIREKDLKGHMLNPDDSESGSKEKDLENEEKNKSEFNKEELDAMKNKSKKGSSKESSKDSKDNKDASFVSDDDDFAPLKYNPKEDFQVREALNYLKGYDTFKRIAK